MLLDKNAIEKEITKAVAQEMRNLIDKSFRQKKDPKGKKWQDTKEGNPFDRHDSIRSSIDVTATGNTIEITSTKPYTGYLNDGTSRGLVPREMYPGDYFPKKWSPIEDKINSIMDKFLENYDPREG